MDLSVDRLISRKFREICETLEFRSFAGSGLRNKFLFLLESTDLLKIAESGWLLQFKLKVSLSSDVFCYIMENYHLSVLNLQKTLPAKN